MAEVIDSGPGYFRFKLSGIDERLQQLDEFQDAYRALLYQTLDDIGSQCTEKMKDGHPPGGPHPAPGEMPQYGEHAYLDRTEELTDSIGYTLTSPAGANTLGVQIFAMADHAEFIEYGTRHARPYPFFWPTLAVVIPPLMEKLQADLDALVAQFSDA